LSTWKYLLDRDFRITDYKEKLYPEINIPYPVNVKGLYLLYSYALNFLTSFYPIVTQRALELFVSTIPISTWPSFGEGIIQYHENFYDPGRISRIFSISEFGAIFDNTDEMNDMSEIGIISETGIYTPISLFDPYFNELFRPILTNFISSIYPNFEELEQQVKQNDCKQFKTLISYPTLVFVNKKPILINYDYELGLELKFSNYDLCDPILKEIERDLLALL
jgi:hypothetical protein